MEMMVEKCCCYETPGDDEACPVHVRHTPNEIRDLNDNWAADPCWDIEYTEGFALYHDELLAFHQQMQAKWDAERQVELREFASHIGLDANLKLAEYVQTLLWRIQILESKSREN